MDLELKILSLVIEISVLSVILMVGESVLRCHHPVTRIGLVWAESWCSNRGAVYISVMGLF